MRVKREDNQYRMRADIFPFGDDQRCIAVERGRDRYTRGETWRGEARITVIALGAVPVEMVRQYAEGLREAVRLADEMNAVPDHEHTTPGGYMVEYRRERDGRTDTIWERIEDGAEVPMHEGWMVAKVPARESTTEKAGVG